MYEELHLYRHTVSVQRCPSLSITSAVPAGSAYTAPASTISQTDSPCSDIPRSSSGIYGTFDSTAASWKGSPLNLSSMFIQRADVLMMSTGYTTPSVSNCVG